MKAVILAAGKGTRMRPLTDTRPKSLIPVAGEPFIKHVIKRLPTSIDEVIMIIGYWSETIREELGGEYDGRRITYVTQEKQLGTGHALLQAKPVIDEDFICIVGDHIWGVEDLMRLVEKKEPGAVVMGRRVEDVSPYGYMRVVEDKLEKIIEKSGDKKPGLVNISAYRLTPQIFEFLENTKKSPRGEIEIVDAINDLAEKNDVWWLECEKWMDFSVPWHVLQVNKALTEEMETEVEGDLSEGATLVEPVKVGEGTKILPGAYIVGPVVIGKDCLIGPNCFIRPNTSIGDNCHVGNGVEIKNSVIFSNTNIPHLNYVGDSVIGEECNLGAGTKIANLRHRGNVKMKVKGKIVDTKRRKLGAIIGDNTYTGINTSIYPGRKLGPNSLTDVGAIVKRNLDSEYILMNDGTLKKIQSL